MSQTSTGDVSEPRRDAGSSSRPSRDDRGGLLQRLSLFFRQVVAEMRKVVRPTRSELITYTAVCMVFVVVVMAYIATLDFGLGKLVLLVFGGNG